MSHGPTGALSYADSCPPLCPDAGRGAGIESAIAALASATADLQTVSSLIDEGNAHADAGRFVPAVESYSKALHLDPNSGPAWHNLANLMLRLNDLDTAIASYRNAVRLLPAEPLCAYSLGRALNLAGCHREALTHLKHASIADPSRSDIWMNLGNAHQFLGQHVDALRCFDRAAQLSAQPAEAEMNRAMILLDQGNFAEGWRAYESRWQLPAFRKTVTRFEGKPRWHGESLQGKRILLHAEQGFGDMIQFARFVPQVAALASQVILEVPKRLWSLFAPLLPSGHVLARGGTLPPYDLHCPLMSLPLALGLEPDAIPGQPYLRVAPEQRQPARHALAVASGGTRPRLRVGLAWRGNPGHQWDRVRSLRPAQLAPLASVPGVQWVLLQQDAKPEELAALPPALSPVFLRQQLDGFLSTAALIEELDLVISVDTVTGHLTGSLGRPLWLMLPAFYDWRWHSGHADSPWYPSARLFRQSEPGDWSGVVERIAAQLAELVP